LDERVNLIRSYADESAALQRKTADRCAQSIVEVADLICHALRSGNKILLCGNGGSAADCQHIAAEFTSRLSKRERGALAAIALTTDSSFLTAYGNDYGFEGVFARQVEALGRPGDVLIGISTSGRSANVRRAVAAARARGMATIGLLGEGGPLENEVDKGIVVPDRDTQHIQEALLPVEHLICQLVEDAMFQ
jgi:D-sedoheptulose 7-phosphate isomerase